jgi:hypothetical protein
MMVAMRLASTPLTTASQGRSPRRQKMKVAAMPMRSCNGASSIG